MLALQRELRLREAASALDAGSDSDAAGPGRAAPERAPFSAAIAALGIAGVFRERGLKHHPRVENKLWYLRRSKLFERATEETVTHCEHYFTQKLFPKRARIFDQGDPARMVYLVKSGKVKLVHLTEDAKEIIITVLGAGDLFGEEVVFGTAPNRTTVAECIEPSLVCMARAENIYSMLSSHPILALNVAKYLMEQRDDALAAIEDVAYLKVSDRIVRLLERLATEHGVPVVGGTLLDVRLTHEEIASLIGSTRETVTTQLSALTKLGRIRFDGRSVVLLGAG